MILKHSRISQCLCKITESVFLFKRCPCFILSQIKYGGHILQILNSIANRTIFLTGKPNNTPSYTEGFEPEAFTYDPEADVYICPQGKILAYSCYNKKGQKKRYLAARKDCSNCPCRQQCIGSSKNSRMVERMLHEEARQEQAKNRNTPEYFAALRLRKIWCEGNFSHQKAEHNLRRTYKRGIECVTEQCLLSACAMNLIRLVKAANAVFIHCLGAIFQGLFRLGYLSTAPKYATLLQR